MAALAPLLRLPPAMVNDENVALLRRLLVAVADARDAREKTWNILERLAWRLLAHPGPAGETQHQLGLEMLRVTVIRTGGLERSRHPLPAGTEHELFARLRPHLEDAAGGDRHGQVVSLASTLGRRGHKVEGLKDLLRRATTAPDDSTARRAIGLWLRGPRVDERLGRLLLDEPSSVHIPAVFTAVNRRRQDLLDGVLAGAPIAGRFRTERFLTASGAHVPPARTGLVRWLPRQQRAYDRLLDEMASDPAQSLSNRCYALGTLARLPELGADSVIGCTENAEVPVAEAAIAVLSRVDRPQEAVATLLGLHS